MKLFNFLQKYYNPTSIVDVLRSKGLLTSLLRCHVCRQHMREGTTKGTDGRRFRCMNRACLVAKSIRTGSFFENSRLPLCDSMLFLHLWSKNYQEKTIIDDFPFSNNTVVDWSRFCRELCVTYFESTERIIGGRGAIVEIDETLIVKRKYNRGRILRAGWLFGGIERREDGQFKCFVKLVYDRSEDHLTHLIQQHIAQGTHIITDGWSAYRNLSNFGYEHSVVIHEENFVSPENNQVHTQTIEATWSSLKRFLRGQGSNKGPHYLEYICEYLFRREHDDVFEGLIECIRTQYPFINQ